MQPTPPSPALTDPLQHFLHGRESQVEVDLILTRGPSVRVEFSQLSQVCLKFRVTVLSKQQYKELTVLLLNMEEERKKKEGRGGREEGGKGRERDRLERTVESM